MKKRVSLDADLFFGRIDVVCGRRGSTSRLEGQHLRGRLRILAQNPIPFLSMTSVKLAWFKGFNKDYRAFLRAENRDWSGLRTGASMAPSADDPAVERWNALVEKVAAAHGITVVYKPVSARAREFRAGKRQSPGAPSEPAPESKKPRVEPRTIVLCEDGSDEFKRAADALHKTLPGATVVEVRWLCGGAIAELYAITKELMGDGANERFLWHGSSVQAVQAIAETGFEPLLSGTTTGQIWGSGIYQARDAEYSLRYSPVDGNGCRTLLWCSALTGTSGQGDRAHRIPPMRDSANALAGRHDSMCDSPADPSIWVLPARNQVLPLALVTIRG